MDIGKEERTIKVDPITSPIPARETKPARKTIPRREPTKAPDKAPVKK